MTDDELAAIEELRVASIENAQEWGDYSFGEELIEQAIPKLVAEVRRLKERNRKEGAEQ